MGMLGCLLCIVGSVVIMLHASSERSLSSVEEMWELAIQPGYEYKSYRHCNKAHTRGYKPTQVLSNMDFCYGCSYCIIMQLNYLNMKLMGVDM